MNQSTVLEPRLVSTSVSPDYLKELREGTIPNQGINHILHYVDHVPETVVYKRSLVVEIKHLDFIEAYLEGFGWVLLTEDIALEG